MHPDRFAHAGEADRRASLHMTTRVNEAYRTLRSPVQRGKYLLELQGVDVAFETNTAMPTDFLMQQMELRERLEGAKDASSLDALRKDLSAQSHFLQERMGQAIDTEKNYKGAADLVRKLMFLDRLGEEIDSAYEALD